MRALGPLAVGLAFAGLAAARWRRFSDPIIDFGAELYLPWRLVEGDLLYADIAYRNGPLSPYLNALWFRLFGVSIDTLVVCNLALLALLCCLAWRLFAPAGRLGQTLVCITLLVGFGFAHFAGIANYNWVTPYQHSQTHGVLLGFALVAALGAALRTGSPVAFAAAGTCLGLSFLTKAELFVPAVAAAATGVALAFAGGRDTRPARGVAILAGAALVPPLAAFGLLALRLPAGLAAAGVLGNWRYLGTGLLADRFYLEGSGLDDPVGNAAALAASLAALALALGAALALDRWLARRPGRRGVGLALAALLFAALVLAGRSLPWLELSRALPATSALAALALALAWRRAGGDAARRAALAPLLIFAVYATALLGKMLLAARFGHYGFALALPATLLLAAGAVEGTAALARRRHGGGEVARALGVALVAALLVGLWRHSELRYARKDFVLGTGHDAIVVERTRGGLVAEALASLDALAAPGATLLALPEGLSLNYWLRRRNPSRYWLFVPSEFDAVGGEDTMLADLRANPPDWIALVDRPNDGFGVGPFGRDARNGEHLAAFVRAEYEPIRQLGEEPFRGRGFGITLLRRRPPVGGAGAPRPKPTESAPRARRSRRPRARRSRRPRARRSRRPRARRSRRPRARRSRRPPKPTTSAPAARPDQAVAEAEGD